VDPFAVEVGNSEVAAVVFAVGDALGDALVRPGRVVVDLVSARMVRRCASPRTSMRSRSSRRRVATSRSQIAFMRGAWAAVRRILVPTAWKTASNEAVKFDPRSRIRKLSVLESLAEAEGKVAGLLHSPLARRTRGDPANVHPAGAMFDEHQDIQSPEEHGVHVQEIDCDNPGGLSVQELPPARARAPRRWIDARGMSDIPHGGRRDCHAGLHELTVDAAVSPQWILLRQADDKAGDAKACRRASRLAPLARVVLPRRQPAVPGQQRSWRHREDLTPALAWYEPRQRGEPGPVGRLIPHPADVPPQYRVLLPEHQQLSILRQLTAKCQDGQAEHPARKHVDDLEHYPAS